VPSREREVVGETDRKTESQVVELWRIQKQRMHEHIATFRYRLTVYQKTQFTKPFSEKNTLLLPQFWPSWQGVLA
jgi:hypothetical protein